MADNISNSNNSENSTLKLPFNVEGITWHAVTAEPAAFNGMKQLMTEQFGIAPMMELEGVTVFAMQNGTLLELYRPDTVPAYGYNDAIALGFRVSDIEAASQALEQAGYELLGSITRVEQMGYAYRHFKAPDGRVYGLNEQK
ncbi:MAG: VOC family protein [Chloroflexota bacterium]|nr:VOC family protein [Chloroflexota bacterium]MDQ5864536.1 VOC family protein [Chloroflexota bacterium]